MMTTERDFLLNHINQSSPPEEVGPHPAFVCVLCSGGEGDIHSRISVSGSGWLCSSFESEPDPRPTILHSRQKCFE